MPAFNESQKAAIKARNQNILVSAAAGSGKTTVMVEKIKETLIAHPEASISQFLVITFTKEAAQNMKDKLRRLLEEAAEGGSDPAARALGEIETATISTIHSFCTQLLKEYNDDAGASMNPRVLSDGEKKKIFSECFQDAGNIVLSAGSPYSREERRDANALMSAFSMEEIGKMVQDLYNVLMGIPEPMDFLARVVDELPCGQWNREIMTSIWLDLLGLEEALQREAELMALPEALEAYGETVQSDAELADAFLQAFRQAGTEEEKIFRPKIPATAERFTISVSQARVKDSGMKTTGCGARPISRTRLGIRPGARAVTIRIRLINSPPVFRGNATF